MAELTVDEPTACVACEVAMPDEALDDDGYCGECAFEADIRRSEDLRDMAEDR